MRASVWSFVLAGLVSATAGAVVPRQTVRVAADTLTAMPASGITKPLRSVATVSSRVPTFAWQRFTSKVGGAWEATWDVATGVPSRIWGSGIAAPGANHSAAIAAQVARQVLAEHIGLLAPGSQASDFELVSNFDDGDIRSVGFVQRANGLRVVGGQVSFRFKRDRLFVIGSEALPNVVVAQPRSALAKQDLRARATAALRTALVLPDAPVGEAGEPVIVPLVGDVAVLGYRIAAPLTIDGGAEGRYLAYTDPATGAVLAVRQLNHFATGSVVFNGIDRYPMRGRVDRPAGHEYVSLDGAAQTTASDGTVSWTGTASQTLAATVTGDYVKVVNQGMGATVATTLSLDPGGQARWDASAVVEDDAQLQIFLDINIVKDFVRTNIDPNMPTIDMPLTANANIAMECNAFFDGTAINFFHATSMCQNSGLVQDVLFHEFGHDLHETEIIAGVGAFDPAMSEGAADTLAVNITGDPGMGRGFFYNDEPIRDLDPVNKEWRWPQDVGEIHHTGLIFGGTFWDLRTAFITKLGPTAGVAYLLKLYLGVLRRSVNIPSTLIEALATDDDDGDLSNGTPNECLIRGVFGAHGLRTVDGTIEAPPTLAQPTVATTVAVELGGLSTRCGGDVIRRVTLDWMPSFTGVPAPGQGPAVLADGGTYRGELMLAVDESVFYNAVAQFTDGSTFTLPDNLGDPFYQLYEGATVPLYCTTFDTDPFAEGWTTSPDRQWSWGVPTGGTTDPPAAFTGTHILAQVLNGDYTPMTNTFVKLPPIDVGRYSDVRLQYRRWLAVEDRQFDQAHITANDVVAWENATANLGDSSAQHHIDKEWRFHDVPLSKYFRGHSLTVGFDLKSDAGLQLGGWQLDDLCVVANIHSICGDGVVSPTEACDSGSANADVADTCRTDCRMPTCGDGIVDSNEECDGGDSCTSMCKLTTVAPSSGGFCSAGSEGGGSALVIVAGVLVARRRRRVTSSGR